MPRDHEYRDRIDAIANGLSNNRNFMQCIVDNVESTIPGNKA